MDTPLIISRRLVMYQVVFIALATAVAGELYESEKIYSGDDFEIAKTRVELAAKRVEEAERAFKEKGERKSARLEQAKVSKVDADKRFKKLVMSGARGYQHASVFMACVAQLLSGGKPGFRLPFELPAALRSTLGSAGGDARDLNPFFATCIFTYVFRSFLGEVLGRGHRRIQAYWSSKDTERFLKSQEKTYNNLKRDS